MTFLKRLLSKRGERIQHAQQCDESVPHLHPKPKPSKQDLKRTAHLELRHTPRYVIFQKHDNPCLPRVVLRPATPPEADMKLEDLLFERSGDFFILRPKPVVERIASSSNIVGHLQVPTRRKRVRRGTSLPPSKSLQEYQEDTGDAETHLDAQCRADYRKYLAGLE
jgi:hypothetical protein